MMLVPHLAVGVFLSIGKLQPAAQILTGVFAVAFRPSGTGRVAGTMMLGSAAVDPQVA
jgi:hypothetical protein